MTCESPPVAAGPRLSLVVPLYRSERLLPELFRRIGDLHIEGGLELVLVNDGSPDATSEVCRRLLGEFPETLHLSICVGISGNTTRSLLVCDTLEEPIS
jgi:glycosyltransferase involved in cell wall biosynthesis